MKQTIFSLLAFFCFSLPCRANQCDSEYTQNHQVLQEIKEEKGRLEKAKDILFKVRENFKTPHDFTSSLDYQSTFFSILNIKNYIQTENIPQMRRVLALYLLGSFREFIHFIDDSEIWTDPDLWEFRETVWDIVGLELLKFGMCGELTSFMTMELLQAGFKQVNTHVVTIENGEDQNHSFLSFYDENGIEYAADPLFNLIMPMDQYQDNGSLQNFFSVYTHEDKILLRGRSYTSQVSPEILEKLKSITQFLKKTIREIKPTQDISDAMKKALESDDIQELKELCKDLLLENKFGLQRG